MTRDIKFRKQQLAGLAKCLRDNADMAREALYKDLHKHRLESDIGEVSPVIDECEYMIKNLDQFSKPTHTVKRSVFSTGTQTYIRKEPKGVVLVIGKLTIPNVFSVLLTFCNRIMELPCRNCVFFFISVESLLLTFYFRSICFYCLL